MTVPGVLAVFAHPDDESLVAGGTLAACAAAGVRVDILSMTRGEAGPICAGGADRALLGAVRAFELDEAGRALGAQTTTCLEYPDGELGDVDGDDAAAEVARHIARRRPDAVITFGAEGLYWHPDHIAVHAIVHRALVDAPVPWVYEATMRRRQMAELVHAMATRGLATDLWGLDPGLFGVPAARITTTVDVRSQLHRKLRALRSHATQIGPGHVLSVVPGDLAERLLGSEFFVRSGAVKPTADWLTSVLACPAEP